MTTRTIGGTASAVKPGDSANQFLAGAISSPIRIIRCSPTPVWLALVRTVGGRGASVAAFWSPSNSGRRSSCLPTCFHPSSPTTTTAGRQGAMPVRSFRADGQLLSQPAARRSGRGDSLAKCARCWSMATTLSAGGFSAPQGSRHGRTTPLTRPPSSHGCAYWPHWPNRCTPLQAASRPCRAQRGEWWRSRGRSVRVPTDPFSRWPRPRVAVPDRGVVGMGRPRPLVPVARAEKYDLKPRTARCRA